MHVDQTDAETATIKGLIDEAEVMIKKSIEFDKYPAIVESPLYSGAVYTLVQAMYYDRSLTNGIPAGVLMKMDYLDVICKTEGGAKDGTK